MHEESEKQLFVKDKVEEINKMYKDDLSKDKECVRPCDVCHIREGVKNFNMQRYGPQIQ